MKHFFIILAGIILLSACNTVERTDLFFGTDISGGGHVSEEQWKNFSDSVIAVNFKEGYTELDTKGKWSEQKTGQLIAEGTKVIIYVGKKGSERELAINRVTQAYIKRFRQEAVFRLDSRPQATVISLKE